MMAKGGTFRHALEMFLFFALQLFVDQYQTERKAFHHLLGESEWKMFAFPNWFLWCFDSNVNSRFTSNSRLLLWFLPTDNDSVRFCKEKGIEWKASRSFSSAPLTQTLIDRPHISSLPSATWLESIKMRKTSAERHLIAHIYDVQKTGLTWKVWKFFLVGNCSKMANEMKFNEAR